MQDRLDPCFHVVWTKFWPYHRRKETHQSNFSIIQFRWASFNGSLSFLLLSDWSGAVFCCCSPSASRFTIRDALLQNSVVTSCYLCSYLIKTVWLFSSDLNIFTQELTLFSIFLDRYRCGKIPPRNAQTNNNATFNITSLPLFLHSEDHFELQQVILTMSKWIDLLSRDWLIKYFTNKELSRWT